MQVRVERGLYILNDAGEPVHVTDPVEWAEWFEANKFSRQVGHDRLGDVQSREVGQILADAHASF